MFAVRGAAKRQHKGDAESAKRRPPGVLEGRLTPFFVCGKLGVCTACFRRGCVVRPRV
jgi:hypothetical protein